MMDESSLLILYNVITYILYNNGVTYIHLQQTEQVGQRSINNPHILFSLQCL